jgi:hypothetical protein
VNDGDTATDKPVEDRGLADIRPPDNRHYAALFHRVFGLNHGLNISQCVSP